MLSITRKEGQRLRIRVGAVDVWVVVAEARGGSAGLWVDAPREAAEVKREELLPAAERWQGKGPAGG